MAAAEQEKINIEDIKKDNELFNNYIFYLYPLKNQSRTLLKVIEIANNYCDGLPTLDQIYNEFGESNPRDKGLLGKITEYALFGNSPNNKSKKDTNHSEIKTTCLSYLKRFKSFKGKERLVLGNINNKKDNIKINELLNETSCYEKIQNITLFCFEYDEKNKKEMSYEDCLNIKFLCVIRIDVNKYLHPIQIEYENNRNMINNNNITQKGQKKLHLCSHGNKGDKKTKAFAFTNNFVTEIIANEFAKYDNVNIEEVLKTESRSIFINNKYLN